MPVQARTPVSSPDNLLFGVYISLDQRMMTELTLEMENLGDYIPMGKGSLPAQGIRLANWYDAFSDAHLQLPQLGDIETDTAVLGDAWLRGLSYAILKDEAGSFARQAYRTGNAIARSIEYVSSHLEAPVSIDDMATRAGMSRAVFQRKFKQVTTMAPIQFVKSMRLNKTAMKS